MDKPKKQQKQLPDIVINLTQNAYYNLLDGTNRLRDLILQKRLKKNGDKSVIYLVKIPEVRLYYVDAALELLPKEQYDKIDKIKNIISNAPKSPIVSGELQCKISIQDLYPMEIGYTKINGSKQQCYLVWLNNKKITVVKLTYQNDGTLKEWLGILIAEQIRFNTLQVFKAAYNLQVLKPDIISKLLYQNFKVAIYNDWDNSNWETKIVLVQKQINKLLSQKKQQFQVKKLVKKI